MATRQRKSESPPAPALIDLYDALLSELERLRAVSSLLGASNGQLDVEVLGGLSLILGDVHDRMREALRAAKEGGKAG